MRVLLALLLLAGAAFALRPLVDDGPPPVAEPVQRAERRLERAAQRVRERRPVPRRVRCPRDADGTCRAVRGRVVLVERVDPDGDGDLHVVVAAGSITAPGLTSIDVRAGLRPRRDPRVGDVVSAAGPVQRGSFGQDQVHALRFRTR